MISLDVKVDKIETRFSETIQKELNQYVLKEVAAAFLGNLEKVVSKELKTTQQQYLDSIKISVRGGGIEIGLRGLLANMLEGGAPAFDMKKGFSRGGKVKMKKGGGWYLTIPISIKKADLSPRLQNIASQRPIKQSDLRGKQGERVRVGTQIPRSKAFEDFQNKFKQGKSEEEKGVQKEMKNSSFIIFRRVSDKSKADSWIHPGLKARNFLGKAMEGFDIDSVVQNSTESFLNGVL